MNWHLLVSNKQLDFLSFLLIWSCVMHNAFSFFCGEEECIYDDSNRLMYDIFSWETVIHTQHIQLAVKY